ncbi:MAG: GreA/GreB family elongation factor [Candidatus Shikimatogenerans bostrichidophilus]|nr:MAG: GreA/GreB family elongation factor [Candidatus Shikimatogenerans bostrichidophilus]
MEYITKKYYKVLKKKLYILENKKKPLILNQIKKSIEKGDLSENYEYISAKESLQLLIYEINKIKNILLNSKIIKNKKNKNKIVKIFSKVTIQNLYTKKNIKYFIVSSTESNILYNKISINSPISLSLINKKEGDIITLTNNIRYKIIKIE